VNKKQKAYLVQTTLNGLYPNPAIPLEHTSPYTLLIAVLLSAQCTDAKVNLVTPILFAKAKTPKEMCKLDIEEIQEIIRPCGLFQTKAKNIWNLSQLLVNQFKGKVPETFEELESLPGVGHKTASVVMAQAFHHPAFPVDTHIFRCAKRWGLSSGNTVEAVEKDLKALFPKNDWIRLHLQIIYFAREYCQARKHDTTECPICSKLTRF
jgi:endonuclease-3